MALIRRASVGPSKIDGLGLIARENISAGDRISEWVAGFDVEFSALKLASLCGPAIEQALRYSWFDFSRNVFRMPSDDDRFMNHSDSPNCRYQNDCCYAICDIAEGEELVMDYRDLIYFGSSR